MSQQSDVSIEELEAAMAAAVDEEGNDLRLAAWVASLSDEERREAEANLSRSLAEARASLRTHSGADDV